MQDQTTPKENLNQESNLQGREASDALKSVEVPQYTERTPEDVGAPEQQQELHELIEKNKEEIKRQEHFSEVAQHKIRQEAIHNRMSEDEKREAKQIAQEISSITDAEQQINKLVELASAKDPYFAIKVAQHLDDNFVLDHVHDELIEDKTRSVLVAKGLLKEV